MKIKSKRVIRMVVCLLLSTMVLACSFSVFAVGEPTPTSTPTFDGQVEWVQELEQDIVVGYVIECLRAWGIYVDEADLGVWEQAILGYIYEYLEGIPSIGSWAKWVMPWAFYSDYWGNTVGNNSFLEDVQDFVDWLVYKLGLATNTIVVLDNMVYKLGDEMYCYSFPIYGFVEDTPYNAELVKISSSDSRNPYVFLCNDGTMIYFLSTHSGTNTGISVSATNLVLNEDSLTTKSNVLYGRLGVWSLTDPVDYVHWDNFNFSLDSQYIKYTPTDVYTGLVTYSYVVNTGIQVHCGEILLPDNDPDYTEGSSIVIIDNGDEHEYIEVTWPDNVNISNLPVVIQPGSIDNPEIEQFYDFIPSFIEEAGDSMNFFKQIIFRMPDEVLYCIYSVLAAGVIFGFLRILREH